MADEKPQCRWCGAYVRKTTRGGKTTWDHVESDNGRCEALRHRYHGGADRPIGPA